MLSCSTHNEKLVKMPKSYPEKEPVYSDLPEDPITTGRTGPTFICADSALRRHLVQGDCNPSFQCYSQPTSPLRSPNTPQQTCLPEMRPAPPGADSALAWSFTAPTQPLRQPINALWDRPARGSLARGGARPANDGAGRRGRGSRRKLRARAQGEWSRNVRVPSGGRRFAPSMRMPPPWGCEAGSLGEGASLESSGFGRRKKAVLRAFCGFSSRILRLSGPGQLTQPERAKYYLDKTPSG
ncbi:hypothetical protein HJG60_007914 [Phyllostomus discolor]|uniref:Uncharacterized protein n=1 Tax=Phyllostomus discolor TaxID=89673 RepID=A0A834BKX4_9CHIR|nr:hypothetical protein HJG60_007914 [Phyllostomus discolor]